MSAAERVAAALRDVADMVEATGIITLDASAGLSWSIGDPLDRSSLTGPAHVYLTLGQGGIAERTEIDAVAEHLGGTLTARHSRSDLWSVSTESGLVLPSGARFGASTCLRGRPLDLAPLPERRRRTGGAA